MNKNESDGLKYAGWGVAMAVFLFLILIVYMQNTKPLELRQNTGDGFYTPQADTCKRAGYQYYIDSEGNQSECGNMTTAILIREEICTSYDKFDKCITKGIRVYKK